MEHKQTNCTVLLIDDDPVTNLINKKLIMRDFKCNVMAHTDAQEALGHLKTLVSSSTDDIPDFIFLDINMPIMDGWEFLTEFQNLSAEILSRCKVYMLSSSIDVEDVEKSRTYNSVSDFISKPLTTEKMKSLLQRNV